jgi:hypothetical protein
VDKARGLVNGLLFMGVLLMALCGVPAGAQTHTFTFEGGTEGWIGDFADYPVSDSALYELAWRHASLPWPLNPADSAFMISGNNHSDDLFMFLKRKITGLIPNRRYRVTITIDVASCYPTNTMGVGGAPGEGVTIKAGAMAIEPQKVQNGSYFRMNIGKGSQIMPGSDMDTIGHIGVTDTTTVYTMIRRSHANHPCTVTANAAGEAWLCIGTDSGFEGTTTLYYDRITVDFDAVTNVDGPRGVPATHQLGLNYPNPFNPQTMIPIDLISDEHVDLRIYDMIGREVAVVVNGIMAAGRQDIPFDGTGLASGVYIYCMRAGQVRSARTMILIR